MMSPEQPGTTNRTTPSWRLAIDLGTTYTSATVDLDGATELVMINGQPRVPSTIAVDDDGQLIAGIGAERVLARAPERAERNPKRRIGDEEFLLGDHRVSTIDALAALIRMVADEAARRFGGTPPTELVLTHPARWGAIRLGRLVAAAELAGLPAPTVVSEPIAAAWAAAATASVAEGETAAIFDLGGGTLDIAVVRRVGVGFEVIGPPGGSDRLGGEMFDERLSTYLGERLAENDPGLWEQLRFSSDRAWRRAAQEFREQVRASKEALSVRTDDTLYLGAPVDRDLRLTRDEITAVIDSDIAATVDELEATVARAGLSADTLDHLFLVGGGSRMPVVAQRLGDWFGNVPTTWGDPKSVVAIGALSAASVDGRYPEAVPPTGAVPVVADADLSELPSAPAPTDSRPRRSRLLVGVLITVLVPLGIGTVWATTRNGADTGAADVTDDRSPSSTSSNDSTTSTTTGATTSTSTTTTTSTTAPSTSVALVSTTTPAMSPTTSPQAPSGGNVGGGTGGATATTIATTAAPVVTAATTTTLAPSTTATPAPTTTANPWRTVPNVTGLDYSEGQQQVVNQGFTTRKNTVTCTGGEPSSQIVSYSPQGSQPPGTTITLNTCI